MKIGDRVRIVQGPNPMLPSDMVGTTGVVAYIDRSPKGGDLLRVEFEAERDMDWYFWPEEVRPVESCD